MTKLVYIGGFGRSGSTLLEVLMAANPEVVACGQVGLFSRRSLTKNGSAAVVSRQTSVQSGVLTFHPHASQDQAGLTNS
jgi:hypothetical protein